MSEVYVKIIVKKYIYSILSLLLYIIKKDKLNSYGVSYDIGSIIIIPHREKSTMENCSLITEHGNVLNLRKLFELNMTVMTSVSQSLRGRIKIDVNQQYLNT